MKNVIIIAAMLCSVSSAAQELTLFEGKPAELDRSERVGALLARSAPQKGIQSSVILDTTGPSLLIPAAARVPGRFETFFLTEVALVNYRNVSQVLSIAWLEQGVESCNAPLQTITLPPQSIARYADFVGIALGRNGVGAVLVVARTSIGGAIDPEGRIDATSRIYTTQPGTTGTTSQSLPTVRPNDFQGPLAVTASLMRHDADFRTNIGIVNLGDDGLTHNWSIRSQGAGAATMMNLSVPACSMVQAPIPEANYGPLSLTISTADVTTPISWSAYAVSIDNRTGDGWVVHPPRP